MGSYLKIDPIRLGKFNNAEYTNFMNRFTLANKLDDGKNVRLELDEQYDDLVTIAFVTSVAAPSKEATDFVMHMNKLMLIPILLITSVSLSVERRRKKQKRNYHQKGYQFWLTFFASTSMKQNTITFVIQIKCLPLYN